MVKHIMKNGQVLEDITGHVVTREAVPVVYEIASRMRKKEKKDEQSRAKQDL